MTKVHLLVRSLILLVPITRRMTSTADPIRIRFMDNAVEFPMDGRILLMTGNVQYVRTYSMDELRDDLIGSTFLECGGGEKCILSFIHSPHRTGQIMRHTVGFINTLEAYPTVWNEWLLPLWNVVQWEILIVGPYTFVRVYVDEETCNEKIALFLNFSQKKLKSDALLRQYTTDPAREKGIPFGQQSKAS